MAKAEYDEKQGKILQGIAQLFGAKAFGALSLALALNEYNQSAIAKWLLNGLNNLYSGFGIFNNWIIMFSWLSTSVLVFTISLVIYIRDKIKEK
jgi:hypothetical protein